MSNLSNQTQQTPPGPELLKKYLHQVDGTWIHAPGAMAAPGLVSRLRVANATTLSRTILPWPHGV